MEKVDPDSGCKMVAIHMKTKKNTEEYCLPNTIYTNEKMSEPQYIDGIDEYE